MGNRLVIVGGGYIGVELARALETHMDVTLVEPRKEFVHAPAMLRSLVDPSVLNQALIPYDCVLKSGTVVAKRAKAVTGNAVVLDDDTNLPADFIVLCPGASNGGIFKPGDENIDAFRAAQGRVHGQIKAAKSIVLVGAGAVGTELAGEIAHAHPEKSVTLISADPQLFPSQPPKLGRKLHQKLMGMGVDVVLGKRVTDLKSTTEPYAGIVTLQDGKTIEADLVIPAIGSRPVTDLFDSLPDVTKGDDGRVTVDEYLRPSSLPNVFAAGDAVDAGDAMTIVATSRQQPWLAKTLKTLNAGKSLDSLKAYSPWKSAPILVPLGPIQGASFLVIATFGDWVTRMIKGRDLFIAKYRKLLGYG